METQPIKTKQTYKNRSYMVSFRQKEMNTSKKDDSRIKKMKKLVKMILFIIIGKNQLGGHIWADT
jgi:hypothetical protein